MNKLCFFIICATLVLEWVDSKTIINKRQLDEETLQYNENQNDEYEVMPSHMHHPKHNENIIKRLMKHLGFQRPKQSSNVLFSTTAPVKTNPTTLRPASTVYMNLDSMAQSKCLTECAVSREYNPVCGSDGRNYTNLSHLRCAGKCGLNVQLVSYGTCQSPSTPAPSLPFTMNFRDEREKCLHTCRVTPELQPVCGSDGISYTNPSYLACAKECGTDVFMVSNGNCPTTQTTTLTTPTITTPLPDSVRDCMNNCPMSFDDNPVCGSDGVTYKNPGHLICASFCDIKVHLEANGPCPKRTIPTLSSNQETTTSSPNIDDNPYDAVTRCMVGCSTNTEYRPVCGSDGITYENFEKHQCASRCGAGVDIAIAYEGECRKTTSTEATIADSETETSKQAECIQNCAVTSEYNPVCGSDGVTYQNPGRMICAMTCGVQLTMAYSGSCSPRQVRTTTDKLLREEDFEVRDCIRNCPVPKEHNPVCGTNFKTYFTVQRLECVRDCGVDVAVMYQGYCPIRRTSSPIVGQALFSLTDNPLLN